MEEGVGRDLRLQVVSPEHFSDVVVGTLETGFPFLHEQWFREFLSRAQIGYGGVYFGPFDGGLFQ